MIDLSLELVYHCCDGLVVTPEHNVLILPLLVEHFGKQVNGIKFMDSYVKAFPLSIPSSLEQSCAIHCPIAFV